MWDGKKGTGSPPTPTRLHGVKKATSIAVGETHLLIVSSLYHPGYLPSFRSSNENLKMQDELDELDEGFVFDDMEPENDLSNTQKEEFENSALQGSKSTPNKSGIPSLKSICEKMAAEHLVEPRNVLQLLEIADALGADDLKTHCEVRITALLRSYLLLLNRFPHNEGIFKISLL